ncbi:MULTISPECIES: diguanylate cyclase [Oxalobacteraceae]|jgi:diguanylate cyclase (GGDEF)-like protein|uniref:sensor domain-containing diguanylate cyclase n=1 Tax=Oxalobacteraceae TaxID=75682 RepID=UPI001455DEF5|nr:MULTISPECIES: diguanylate cyclase [Oxalobacteraceae]
MNKSSLRRQLVLPYVLLVVFVSATIGWVSYQAGEKAVSTLGHRVMADMVNRINTATEQHLAGALTALHAIDPDPQTLPQAQPFSDSLAALEPRLWVASGLFMDVNNYVYFGGEDGRFIGVNRVNKDFVELYLREPGAPKRHVYAVTRPGDRARLLRSDQYDPRTRPWYDIAARSKKPVWSPVYSDFTSKEPTITLAKPVYREDKTFAGVMATDVTLKALTDFLRSLKVSQSGIAFVLDSDGFMIATSGTELPFKMVNGAPERMRIDEMQTPLIRDAYAKVREWKNAKTGDTATSPELAAPAGYLEVAAARLGEKYGVNWVTVVAVPRVDFMGGVTRSFIHGLLIALLCVIAALVLGLFFLDRVLRDIRNLTEAAKRIGDGEPMPSLNIRRSDEIGQLATSFREMEHNLRIDKLTAVFNRASLIAQIGFLRRQLAQNNVERPNFALLFIDLDHFKTVNDHYGHSAGDKVLATVATRLKESVRITDVVARYGGDEFVVLLKGVTAVDDVIATEEKIRGIVEEPVPLDHGTASVGVSIGWAMFPEDGEDVDALLKIADTRMFDTKKIRKAAR